MSSPDTRSISLSLYDRHMIASKIMPAEVPGGRHVARMVRSLRKRLALSQEEYARVQQLPSGRIAFPQEQEEHEFTDQERELLGLGLQALEQGGQFPTSDAFLDLDERLRSFLSDEEPDTSGIPTVEGARSPEKRSPEKRTNGHAANGHATNGEDPYEQVPDLEGLTKGQLYELAQEHDIPGRSSMTKKELTKALLEASAP